MKSVKTLTRRAFLRQSTMAAGALSVSPLVMSRAFGDANPSDKITVGAIGIAGRGRYILNAFLQYSDVKVVAVCDVFADRRNRAKQMVDEHYGNDDCAAYIDARELIARPDIDAVMIATGDNNHAPLSILAA
ncbi:MAG TPA: Gfo/Idh/MocA family oxidoreductase, partial [Candidatus Hydrogenedentes bacterium]|nr:Gfo/Idh/MocA family oxidoreductase [Candidatus Hydrogenedentota bacterium]